MENSVFNQPEEAAINRFAIPVKFGVLTGLVCCILTTINFQFLLSQYWLFLGTNFLIFIVAVFFYWLTGTRQRKAFGGYIDIKQAFQAIFIVILISNLITTIYGIIYAVYIDPAVFERIKEATLAFMESMNAPEERMEQTMADIDRQVEESLKPGKIAYSFATSLIMHSIFGFICALAVKKPRPVI